MKLPTPPANSLTDAIQGAADQVVDAYEQVVEAVIGVAGEMNSADMQAQLRLIQQTLLLAKAAKEEARGRVVAAARNGVLTVEATAAAQVLEAAAMVVLAAMLTVLVVGSTNSVAAMGRAVLEVVRFNAALATFLVAREVANSQGVAQRFDKEQRAVDASFADLQAEIRNRRSRTRDADNKINEERAVRDRMLGNIEEAGRRLEEIAAAVTGSGPAKGVSVPPSSAAPPASAKPPDGFRHQDRLDRLAGKLKDYALRHSELPLGVRGQVTEVLSPMPRIQLPSITPKVGVAMPLTSWPRRP